MKIFLRLSIFINIWLFAAQVNAQQSGAVPIKKIPVKPRSAAVKDSVAASTAISNQKDITDVIARVFNQKPGAEVDSITTRPTMSIVPALGYTRGSRWALVLSG